MSENQAWRVVLEGGEVREVLVTRDARGWWEAQCPQEASRGGMLSQNTARHAVMELAANHKWPVVEILAPGQPSRADGEAEAFARGAEAMREAAAKAAEWDDDRFDGYHAPDVQEVIERAIRALPLPVEAAPQPAQNPEAPATPDAPLTVADAEARERMAAMERESAPTTPRGREVRYADLRVGDRVRTCGDGAEVMRVDPVSPDEVMVVFRFSDHVETRERVNAAYLVEVVR